MQWRLPASPTEPRPAPSALLPELSIDPNLRRVEALTGHGTLTHLHTERRLLDEVARHFGARPTDALCNRLGALAAAQAELHAAALGMSTKKYFQRAAADRALAWQRGTGCVP